MPRSSRRRPRKHDGYRGEWDGSSSDEDQGAREQEDKKGSARASKNSEQEKRLSSALPKHSDVGDPSGSSTEGQKKRKRREEQEAVARDDRWSSGGGGDGDGEEDDGAGYYYSKKSRNSDGNVKGKSARKVEKSDRSNELGRRKTDRALLEDDAEHHQVNEVVREQGAGKLKESKQMVVLKEDNMDQPHKTVKDRSWENVAEKGDEGKHDASPKVNMRDKEVKSRDSEGDRAKRDHKSQLELHDRELQNNGRHMQTKDHAAGKDESQCGSKDRQIISRDDHRDEKLKDEMSRSVEKRRDGEYKFGRSKPHEKHRDNKYKDDRHKEEEMYKEERSRNEDIHRDEKYKGKRSRYTEKYRNERSDDCPRENHQDNIYRNHRHQDGRSWDVRSSKDNTRGRSLEKNYKEEHNYSGSRQNKNRPHDIEGDTYTADHRSSKYRDDNKGKKRLYEESVNDGVVESRNTKEHGDATRRNSEVGSFVSSVDRRREYVIQEKVDSRRRDYEKKSPTRSSTYLVREQSRNFSKQEDSSPKEYNGAAGRHRRTFDPQFLDGQIKTDISINEYSLASKDSRSLRSDSWPVRVDKSPSASDRQVLNRNNMRRSHGTDDSLKKVNARHYDLPLNRQASENYKNESPREHRSNSRSRRSGTLDNAREHGLGNFWNNPPSLPSPVPNGFVPFQSGPPPPGFHPVMPHFPHPYFGMLPSVEGYSNREVYSNRGQQFPWYNHLEDPYPPRLPGWDVSENIFEEHSHGYDRKELIRNNDLHLEQQSKVLSGTSDNPSPVQFSNQIQSEQSMTKCSETKIFVETGKVDLQTSKCKSERKPRPFNVKEDNSKFCSRYFKRLDISKSLTSPELYKKCVTMVGTLNLVGSYKLDMLRSLQDKKLKHECQSKGSEYMIKSIFPGKSTSIFENAMALYRSTTGSMKSKIPASSSHPEIEKVLEEASEDMVGGVNVTAQEVQSLPHTMCNEVKNNDRPHDEADLNIHGESGLANVCSNRDDSNIGDKSLKIDHRQGHACYTEELQDLNNNEGDLPHDASHTDVAKEQFCGVISDAAFVSSSQACEDVMPDCRVNLSRIPCSPGST